MRNVCCTFSSAVSKSVKRTFYVISFLSILFATPSFASPGIGTPAPTPSASATPDLGTVPQLPLQEATKNAAKNYQIGDRINLLVELSSPGLENGDHLNLKLPEGSSALEDQGWYIDPSSQFLGGTFRFIVSPIQSGALTLPTLLISRDDNVVLGRTAPYSIQVTAPEKKDDAQAPELLEITSASLPTKYWVIFSIFTLLLIAFAAYGIYRYLETRRRKPTSIPQVEVEPSHVLALRKINELYQNYPYTLENLKPVAFGISETLKEFFGSRFKVDASEATSDEMIELLRREAISGESLREIQVLFQDLDLVKFTKVENYSHFDSAKYQDFKVKSQLIIQKWTLHSLPRGPVV